MRFLRGESLCFDWYLLKFVSESGIDNMPALAQLMTWRGTGAKLLPEPMAARSTGSPGHYMPSFKSTSKELELEVTWHRRIESSCPETWWRHDMEVFSTLLVLYAENPAVTDEFPTKIYGNTEIWCFHWSYLAWRSSWANNRVVGDLRRHDAHVTSL